MRNSFIVGAMLLALLPGCSPDATAPVVAVRQIPDPAPFQRASDCFARWPSYDAWVDHVKSMNAWWNPKVRLLRFAFPRKDFERAQQQLECTAIAYESDDLTISGWMVVPKGKPDRKLPVLIYNRGGNGNFGAVSFPMLMRNVFPYAEQGFLVLVSQYRGVPEGDPAHSGTDQFGGDDVRDVTRLVGLARQLPNADPDNIFMLGVSRGGMMSFMAARRSHDIKAMAVISGVSDLESELQFRPEMEQVYAGRIPGYATDKSRLLAERSVLAWADELPADMPVLLLGGEEDERVDIANAKRLHARLDQLQHPNKLIVYPGDDHFLSDHRKEAIGEVVDWFHAAMARPAWNRDGAAAQSAVLDSSQVTGNRPSLR